MTEKNLSFISEPVQKLLERGVVIPCPSSVEVDSSVDSNRIAPGVVIHTGCKILGKKTSIGPGSVLGGEAPSTVDNCQLGANVLLKGGFFSDSVFLDNVHMGSCSHVRSGSLMEENVVVAHSVGLKQTVFLSFMTAGSLINFCDVLMYGGCSRQKHSEIGSSYIHFNFTPYGDKATASLIGDVPRGVMMDKAPVFLGGQGGLVGPARIEYGCIIPAGVIYREDALEEGQLLVSAPLVERKRDFNSSTFRPNERILKNNLIYIGNLRALEAWYREVRVATMCNDEYGVACHESSIALLKLAVEERIGRLKQLSDIMRDGGSEGSSFVVQFEEMQGMLEAGPDDNLGGEDRNIFLSEWEKVSKGTNHIGAVATLSDEAKSSGAAWLQAIVDAVAGS